MSPTALLGRLVSVGLLALCFAASALALDAPTMRACGNTAADGVLIGDITATRVVCRAASGHRPRGRGRVRQQRGSTELYRVVRPDYGS